jgi:hypothetical protein
MDQTREAMAQHLAERLCWQVARRLYRQPWGDGGYRLDAGALLDDFFHCLQAVEVMALLEQVHGTAIQREMLPCVQYVLHYSLKTLFEIDSMKALAVLLFSDEALMQLVGFKALHVRQGICQRGATTRQGARTPGPICPATLAEHIVRQNVWDLEAVFHGSLRALAKAGGFGAKVTGLADGIDLETTERYTGCGQVTCQVRIEDKRGRVHDIEVTV